MTRISCRGTPGFATCRTISDFVPLLGASNPIGGGTSEVVLSRGFIRDGASSEVVLSRGVSGFVRDGASSDILRDRVSSGVVLSRRVSGFGRDGANSDILRDRLSSVLSTGLVASVLARCRGMSLDGPLGRSQELRTEPKTSRELLE